MTCNEDSEIVWHVRRRGGRVGVVREGVVLVTDHRHLQRETLHSLLRCSPLYTGLMLQSWRTRDWAHWSERGM